jgi:hypothetical protein
MGPPLLISTSSSVAKQPFLSHGLHYKIPLGLSIGHPVFSLDIATVILLQYKVVSLESRHPT